METVLFVQSPDSVHGACNVFFRGEKVDSCDMNKKECYTQAHIALSRILRRSKISLDSVLIEVQSSGNPVGTYSVKDIRTMTQNIIEYNL